MTVRKTNTTKAVYRVTAVYTGKFKTRTDAVNVFKRMKSRPKVQLTPIKKVSGGYGFSAKNCFMTANAKIRDDAISVAQSRGARVTVKTLALKR